jgi:hypothetical protein
MATNFPVRLEPCLRPFSTMAQQQLRLILHHHLPMAANITVRLLLFLHCHSPFLETHCSLRQTHFVTSILAQSSQFTFRTLLRLYRYLNLSLLRQILFRSFVFELSTQISFGINIICICLRLYFEQVYCSIQPLLQDSRFLRTKSLRLR